MAKRKDAKALFEVLSGSKKAKPPLGVPGWFGQPGSTSAPPTAPEAPPETGDPQRFLSGWGTPAEEGLPIRPPAAGPAEPRPLRPAKVSEPIVSMSDGRVRFSFNQVSATVVVIGLVVIILAAYLLGRRAKIEGIYAPNRPDVLEVGDGSSSVVPVPAGKGRTPPSQPGGPQAPAVKREKGASYLIIQGGVNTLQEAQDIQRFLQGKGVNVTIEKQHTRFYIVKDTRPWRDVGAKQTRQELADYVRVLTKLGQEYMQQGGAYSFRQGSPDRPWLQTEN